LWEFLPDKSTIRSERSGQFEIEDAKWRAFPWLFLAVKCDMIGYVQFNFIYSKRDKRHKQLENYTFKLKCICLNNNNSADDF